MAGPNPFAGIRLSEQATPAPSSKLDQRLFGESESKANVPSESTSAKKASPESGRPTPIEQTSPPPAATTPSRRSSAPRQGLSAKPLYSEGSRSQGEEEPQQDTLEAVQAAPRVPSAAVQTPPQPAPLPLPGPSLPQNTLADPLSPPLAATAPDTQGNTTPTVAQLRPASLVAPTFDLNDEALYKATFVFTQDEGEALEDLKIQLRRELDAKVNKYDLIRAALHLLIEDYAATGERSYVFRKLRERFRR